MIQSLDTIQEANRFLQQILDFMLAHEPAPQHVSNDQRPRMHSHNYPDVSFSYSGDASVACTTIRNNFKVRTRCAAR